MRHHRIILFFLVFNLYLYPQVNLVPNASFDNNTGCPTITGQYHLCTGWLNCNGNIGVGLWGTPDYYHACGIFNATYNPIPPNTAQGFCNTHTGGGMMGIVCYNTPYPNYREYISTKLNCSMQPGNTYTVSFWISAGSSPKVKYNTSHFGVYLSNTMPVQTGFSPILVSAQYEITNVVSNTNWVQHTFTITPTATLDWITLGCFRTDAACSQSLATSSAPYPYSNYYIDDISVVGSNSIPTTFNVQDVSCNSTNNGSVSVTPLAAGSYSYNWQPGNQTTSSINNLSVGIYTLTISNNCGSETKTVSVNQTPSPTLAITSVTTCPNSIISLTATSSGSSPNYTYSWSSGTSTASFVTLNATGGLITCTVTDSQGCKAVSSGSITVSPSTSSFLYTLNSCNGIISTTNTSTGATIYNWDFGDGYTSTNAAPSHTYSSPGSYTIHLLTNNSNGCKDSTLQIVNISSTSQSVFNQTTTICSSTVQLSNSSIGANTYFWDFGDGGTSSVSNPGSHIYSTSGTYTISLITNPGSSCADTSYQVIQVIKDTQSQFNILTTTCAYSVTATNTSSFTLNYYWDFGDGFTSTNAAPAHTYSASGIYTITLIGNPGTTCADTIYKTVNIINPPIAAFNYIKDPCSALVTFTNNSINATNYYWHFGGTNTSNLINPVFDFNKPGNYTVMLIAQPGISCADTIIHTINISYSSITADFSYENLQYSYDVILTNLSTNALTYEWSFGDGTNSTQYQPSHTYNLMGDYTICLRATNSIGCYNTVCKNIKVDADWTLYIPNTFSPNDDGLNDTFHAYGTNIKKYQISIFDRWGEKIFSSEDILASWDGKYKGKLVPEDVYIWKIIFTDAYSKSHEKTGHITVIR